MSGGYYPADNTEADLFGKFVSATGMTALLKQNKNRNRNKNSIWHQVCNSKHSMLLVTARLIPGPMLAFSIINVIHAENLKEESKIIHHSKGVSIKIWRISLLSFFYGYFSIIMFVALYVKSLHSEFQFNVIT